MEGRILPLDDLAAGEWAPPVDISEGDDEYLICVELTDVKKEDIQVTADGGILHISGERRLGTEQKSRKFHRLERGYGTFQRSFSIPDDAESGKIRAEFRQGLLRIHLPKTEGARSEPIQIQVR